MARIVPYCPSCSVTIGHPGRWTEVTAAAQHHARITGHVVQLADEDTWESHGSIAGEPSLPLWESEGP